MGEGKATSEGGQCETCKLRTFYKRQYSDIKISPHPHTRKGAEVSKLTPFQNQVFLLTAT
jgi:hypothetical protein